jgi:hypothetical protein
MNRKTTAIALFAAFPLCFAAFGSNAQELIPLQDAPVVAAPAQEDAAPIQVVENTPARPVTGVQLPPQRPNRVASVRRAADVKARQRAAASRAAPVRVAQVQSESLSGQRVAAQAKPKSPLFWMTVGVGF